MKRLIEWSVRNSAAMNALMVGVLIIGSLGLWNMQREMYPQFNLDLILVTTRFPGATPEEVEEGICQKIEEQVRSVEGINKVSSIAKENVGYLIIELRAGADVDQTLDRVRAEVDRIETFPDRSEDPQIESLSYRIASLQVGVVGPMDGGLDAELRLREVADDIRQQLLDLPSVASATIAGRRDYQVAVEISEQRLREYGLTLRQIGEIIRRENVELSGGKIKSPNQEFLLRGKHKTSLAAEIGQLPIVRGDGVVSVNVDQLGTVSDGFSETTAISRIDGAPGLTISVSRSGEDDLLRMVDEVQRFVDRAELPDGYRLKTWLDESRMVRQRLQLLVTNGVEGLCLVFFVLAIFLNFRLSFWVAMGIPVAVLGAAGVLYASGQSLNMLTTFAFLMALGIVVDDAIVIGENIYAHRERGADVMTAAVNGTFEVLPAVCASVGTTMIAFAPLLFVSGVMGKFIAVLPIAVIAMLGISLVESMIILPSHLAESGTVASDPSHSSGGLLQVYQSSRRLANRGLETVKHQLYLPALRWSIDRPGVVVCGALSVLLMSLGLVRAGITPFVVFPRSDSNEIEANVVFPDGTPAETTLAAAQQIEAALLCIAADAAGPVPLVRTSRIIVGDQEDQSRFGPQNLASGSHLGRVAIELADPAERDSHSEQIVAAWREAVGPIPGAEELTFASREFGPGGAPIEFQLLADAPHMSQLQAAAELCKSKLAEYQGVVDIRDDLQTGKWEYQLEIKEPAKAMGISLAQLAESVRAAYHGAEVMTLQRGAHEVELIVRYPAAERRCLDSLLEMNIRTPEGREYPVRELAAIELKRGWAEIKRVDQKRAITISAGLDESQGNARRTVEDLRRNFIPRLLADHPDVRVRWEGQQAQTNESVSSLLRGLVVALLAMFFVLTLQFRSYLQPLIILATVPFGIIGAVIGHALLGLPLTLLSLFGFVALCGIVINDSIVLIDFINRRMAQGADLQDALIEAGTQRFRPVLLTSITTIAGLIPIMLETSYQAQFLIPLAATLVFGLLGATGLVLILVPTYYAIYQRCRLKSGS